jgi:hypothetical protein
VIREVGLSLRDWLLGQVRRDLPDSTEDWKAGDVAVCAQNGGWHYRGQHDVPAPGPALGEMRKVVEVGLYRGCQYLRLVGYTGGWYHAASFTKLRGDKIEEASEDFVRRIKRQPVREPELV